jgi:hypothetical protein
MFPIMFSQLGANTLGVLLMFAAWAGATGLLVYNSIMKPKYIYSRETVVEDFRRYTKALDQQKAVKRSLHSIIWSISLVIYFIISFATHAWHLTWLIFILAAAVGQIVSLVFAANSNR